MVDFLEIVHLLCAISSEFWKLSCSQQEGLEKGVPEVRCCCAFLGCLHKGKHFSES